MTLSIVLIKHIPLCGQISFAHIAIDFCMYVFVCHVLNAHINFEIPAGKRIDIKGFSRSEARSKSRNTCLALTVCCLILGGTVDQEVDGLAAMTFKERVLLVEVLQITPVVETAAVDMGALVGMLEGMVLESLVLGTYFQLLIALHTV
ncbi:hypothetical protein VNO77_01211 [Canavalia gladiata]|uniref:Uncharacterized protein n=1 Tax=Canavalia gladiata TaxID=3824 RepID=A0AAN9MXC4_CANGL